jgi:chromosome segregation ATPase
LKDTNSKLQAKIRSAAADSCSSEAQLAALQDKHAKQQQDIASLRQQLSELQAAARQHGARVEELEAARGQAAAEAQATATQLQDAQLKLAAAQAAAATGSQQAAAAAAEREAALAAALTDAQAALAAQQAASADAEQRQRQAVSRLQEQVRQLEMEKQVRRRLRCRGVCDSRRDAASEQQGSSGVTAARRPCLTRALRSCANQPPRAHHRSCCQTLAMPAALSCARSAH